MRVIGLIRSDKQSEAGAPPTTELLEDMGRFIEEVVSAGVLLSANVVQPSSKSVWAGSFDL